MNIENSVDLYRRLEEEFQKTSIYRPMHVAHYDSGTELDYDIISVAEANKGHIRLLVDKFVGGGFAGQVYRVKVLDIESDGPVEGLEKDGTYAVKILIPPENSSRLFRDALYWIGFQGPFQLQVNPVAARSGALWQKFIRRAAKIRFGNENSVTDILATFVDPTLGSCGELSEWIDGRTWRLEVDEYLDLLNYWERGKKIDTGHLGSPEYRAKKVFMTEFVRLLHDMGAHEFARQYEWSTWKSQPNCLKRTDRNNSPDEGLVAVDFRAGLTLLPFLPMSPGDFGLIFKGFFRGSLIQFDRGNINKLKQYVEVYKEEFAGMNRMMEELEKDEHIYRDSIPDITHNHVRLLFSKKLWSTILASAVTGWKVRNLINEKCQERLEKSRVLTLIFLLVGFIPLLGRFIRRIWGQQYWRDHYGSLFTSRDYFKRAFQAKVIEKTIAWHRAGRISTRQVGSIIKIRWPLLWHIPLSIIPVVFVHRFLTDWEFVKGNLYYLLIRPVKLYFDPEMREQWLRDMVEEGKQKHIISEDDSETILSQIKEPFIQKYLKSLAVHVCTLPVTQVVSLMVAGIYILMHPELSREQAFVHGLGIIAVFQVVPLSPGSLVRGLYVLYLVIKERNFKDYNIAVFLGFFKYIGYLAFPIQMTYRYPAMARFMAGHWATNAAHSVPVFGEHGALLEHKVYGMFYNLPLTIRRRMRKRIEKRADLKSRYWHVLPCALTGAAIFGIADNFWALNRGVSPSLSDIWWITFFIPVLCGSAVTLGAAGTALWKRFASAALCGGLAGIFYTLIPIIWSGFGYFDFSESLVTCMWRVFSLTIFSTIGAVLTEIKLPDPDLK